MAKPVRELKHKDTSTPEGKYLTKVQLDWVPLPEVLIQRLGWEDGAELELVPIYGNQIVVRRKGALQGGSENAKRNTEGSGTDTRTS